jgi:PEGA domain
VSGIGFAISASDLLAVLLKYYPDPLSPGGKQLLSSPDSTAGAKSSPPGQEFGTIELSEPKAAEVYVDGKFAGDIPWSSPLAAGKDYLIVVKAPGRADWSKRIYVFADVHTTLSPWPE